MDNTITHGFKFDDLKEQALGEHFELTVLKIV